MQIELKPCPFCGITPRLNRHTNDSVLHKSNHCALSCRDIPLKQWNTRVETSQSEGTILPIGGQPVEITEQVAKAIFESRYPFSWETASKRVLNENLYAEADQYRRDAKAAIAVCESARNVGEFTLLGILADIRQKTGVGDKPMLSELADTLAGLIKRESVSLSAGGKAIENAKYFNHPDFAKEYAKACAEAWGLPYDS